MGQCEGICRTVKKNEEFKIEPLLQDNIDSKFYTSPYYAKIVYLQLKLKKFLHSKKSLTLINKQNINVNINLNVNMPNKNDVPTNNNSNATQDIDNFKFCSSCGAKVSKDSEFCTNCGKKFD